jgi:hypothetical protein
MNVKAMFVLVIGMMFLVPAITQKALAGIRAVAEGTCRANTDRALPCEFSFVNKSLNKAASWISEPTKSGTRVTWVTHGEGFFDEFGYVTYSLVDPGWKDLPKNEVKLYFINPAIGRNSCDVKVLSGLVSGSCHAGSGMNAAFTYTLRVNLVAVK